MYVTQKGCNNIITRVTAEARYDPGLQAARMNAVLDSSGNFPTSSSCGSSSAAAKKKRKTRKRRTRRPWGRCLLPANGRKIIINSTFKISSKSNSAATKVYVYVKTRRSCHYWNGFQPWNVKFTPSSMPEFIYSYNFTCTCGNCRSCYKRMEIE